MKYYISNENSLLYTGRAGNGVLWTTDTTEAFAYETADIARHRIQTVPAFSGCHVFASEKNALKGTAMTNSTPVFYADCDQFDDSRTGFHATENDAIEAFWSQNIFTTNEQKRILVYTREENHDDPDVIEAADSLADCGIASPALAVTANC